MNEKNCVVCGKTFAPKSNIQICCTPECSGLRKINLEAKYRTEHRYKKSTGTAASKRKKKVNAITDIAIAARAAGMSYGQYVALHKL